MALLIFKSEDVKHPGSRGGKGYRDEHGKWHYGEKPSEEKRPVKYLAVITFSDGSKKYIEPEDTDENGQMSQSQIRDTINAQLFGEYGFKDGKFWQKKGLLVEYKPRTTSTGKVVVEEIQRHDGYTSFELRDSSVERAYGKGLPKKITQYAVQSRLPAETGTPSKDKVEDSGDARDTADVPVDEMGIRNIPKTLPMTEVALDVPLRENEDPVSLAHWFLSIFLRARKPSSAKTEAGQAKARAERKGQFDAVAGERDVGGFTPYLDKDSFNREPKGLPAWIVNKFDSPEHLQQELGRENDMEWFADGSKKRAEGGRPLTTLITFGLWNPDNKEKRVREQLVKEWTPFLRRWARRYANVMTGTDTYRKFEASGSSNTFMRERERDLFNQGVEILLHEANNYKSNDEAGTIASRFDRTAENAIKSEMRRMSREIALDHGATAVEDLSEEDAYHAPKTISPREHFELRHLEPLAMDILTDAMAGLKPHVRAAFESRMWIDDYRNHTDSSEERKFNESRARQAEKHGESRLHWGRPWIGSEGGVTSMASKLADQIVTLRGGEQKRLGDLKPQHQRYYLDQWWNDAVAHIGEHLKTKDGNLSPNGRLVEKWLRLEQKLAHVNRKDIQTRMELPMTQMKMPTPHISEKKDHPALAFFRNNRELARRLGIADNLDLPTSMQHMKAPTSQLKRQTPYETLTTYHKLHENLQSIANLAPLHAEATAHANTARDLGHWTKDDKGNAAWHE
jgi:hypothetical protein